MPFRCDVCNIKFEENDNLIQHLLSHSGDKLLCDVGHERMEQKDILPHHLSFQTTQNHPWLEGIVKFNEQDYAKQHPLTTKALFECNTCDRKFSSQGSYKDHLSKHSGETRYECKVCKKKFSAKSTFMRHMSKHVMIDPAHPSSEVSCLAQNVYQCGVCNDEFSTISLLQHHYALHSNRSTECVECSRKFSSLESLMMHTKVFHTADKPFECRLCKQKFSKQYHLRRHVCPFYK